MENKPNNSTFCLAPWLALYVGPDTEIVPCCIFDWNNPLGQLKDGSSIHEVINNEKYVNLRKDLYNGVKPKSCDHCWKQEGFYSTDRSMRLNLKRKYGDLTQEVLENTNEDFTLKETKFYFLDIRFSNKCNLKCRTCGSHFSSSWYADEEKLGWRKASVNGQVFTNNKLKKSVNEEFLDFILSQLPHVKEIYFAGGEPLIQDEHYIVLDRLIELGRQNEVEIRYNTNFSNFTYKDKNVLGYWKQFKNVVIGASLDANYERGEYMRKNLVWANAVENRKKLLKECPHIHFHVALTLSIFNAYNVTDFHKEWVELGLIGPQDFMVTPLYDPKPYRIANLPIHHKEAIKERFNNHLEWLESFKFDNGDLMYKWAIDSFRGVMNYIDTDPLPGWEREFVFRNGSVDNVRGENFFDVFPEYNDLKEKLSGSANIL